MDVLIRVFFFLTNVMFFFFQEKEGGRGANFGAKILIRGTNADGYSRKFVEKGELGMMGARCLWDREKI